MKRTLLPALAAILFSGASAATAHELGGMPHPHPHAGALVMPEGAVALVLLLGLATAATLAVLLRRAGRLDISNDRRPSGLRRNSWQA